MAKRDHILYPPLKSLDGETPVVEIKVKEYNTEKVMQALKESTLKEQVDSFIFDEVIQILLLCREELQDQTINLFPYLSVVRGVELVRIVNEEKSKEASPNSRIISLDLMTRYKEVPVHRDWFEIGFTCCLGLFCLYAFCF